MKFLIFSILVATVTGCGLKDEKDSKRDSELSPWTSDEKTQYLDECKSTLGSADEEGANQYCDCSLTKVRERYSFQEYQALEDESNDQYELLNSIDAACTSLKPTSDAGGSSERRTPDPSAPPKDSLESDWAKQYMANLEGTRQFAEKNDWEFKHPYIFNATTDTAKYFSKSDFNGSGSITFKGNKFTKKIAFNPSFASSEGQAPTYAFEYSGTFEVKRVIDGEKALAIDFDITSSHITLDGMDAGFEFCGLKDWTMKEKRDMAGSVCALSKIYDSFKFSELENALVFGNRIYEGSDGRVENGFTEKRRPISRIDHSFAGSSN